MSISFNTIQKQPVQLTNKTHYNLKNKQIRQVCQLKGYAEYVNGADTIQKTKSKMNMAADTLGMFDPDKAKKIRGMTGLLGQLEKQLGYTSQDEKYITINDMSNDLDTLDHAQCIQKTRPRMIGKTDQCIKSNNLVDFKTLMTEC